MKILFKLLVVGLIFICCGCMEIETKIILQLDGSAVVKETIKLHKELLDFVDESGKPIMATFLEKPACESRAKLFGEGATLVNHSIKNLNDGVRCLEAEYKIGDINNLNIVNPYLSFTNYKDMGVAKFKLYPKMKSGPNDGTAGQMCLEIITEKKGEYQKRIEKGEERIKPPIPSVLQKYRDLQPVFRDLLKDFKLSVTFQCYSAVNLFTGYRDRTSNPRSCEIFSFSGKQFDNTGGLLIDNDEIMQELLRLKFWDYNFSNAYRDFANNATVPVISALGSPYASYHMNASLRIFFKPSKVMFDKHFAGKKIDYDVWQSTGKNIFDADFNKIGFDPAKDTMKSAQETEQKQPSAEPAKEPEATK